MSARFDFMDKKILHALQLNGRISNAKLAEQVNLSQSQCLRRLRNLEERGVIDGYSARLNRANIGLGVMAIVLVTLETNSEQGGQHLRQFARNNPEIIECHGTAGPADYVLRVVSSDIESYSFFLTQRLSTCQGVVKTQSHLLMEYVKEGTGYPLDQIADG
jgi:Lrp/AsnC family transcriptional regulator, leucine-responsive regulatory protein